ncbi:MAG TPA: hypothetical protein VLX44_01730 [Xanthobacteraceae bacterium]|nr:hypothetical protein [Xanthobacteraceae bacterium]
MLKPVGDAVTASTIDDLRRAALRAARDDVRASLRRSPGMGAEFLAAARTVILVSSSSRSGSSLFVQLLKRSTGFLHGCGEINPSLRLAGLAWPESSCDSDALTAPDAKGTALAIFGDHLASEVCAEGPASIHAPADDAFGERLFRRLRLQWPLEDIAIGDVQAAMREAVRAIETRERRRCDWSIDLAAFHLAVLTTLRRKHPGINPYYYDIDEALIRAALPALAAPTGPPAPVLIEEPPFILIRPSEPWGAADLARRPVVLKTPSDAYRYDFLRCAFSNARFRILHLTRNPGAAIADLCAGWRYRGFHSHYIGADLEVPGYSEPGMPDRGWWKYDLPPDWRSHARGSLEAICAFQWAAAHRAILDHLGCSSVDRHRVHFEDILLSVAERRADRLDALRAWLGEPSFLADPAQGLPPVMTTHPPRLGGWRDHRAAIDPVLAEPDIRQVIAALGYGDEAQWI